MTISEFSNQFDVLYNNITSNQAPGLNEYEKSVFLTKAEKEVTLNHFTANSKGNNIGQGFDDSAKRQADFSVLMKTRKCTPIKSSGNPTDRCYRFILPDNTVIELDSITIIDPLTSSEMELSDGTYNITVTRVPGTWHKEGETDVTGTYDDDFVADLPTSEAWKEEHHDPTFPYESVNDAEDDGWEYIEAYIVQTTLNGIVLTITGNGLPTKNCTLEVITYYNEKIDPRSGVYSFPEDTFIIINESLYTFDKKILQVIPLRYDEYTRLMSKPFKRPLKNQAWRLMNSGEMTSSSMARKYAEIIVNTWDENRICNYNVRYVRVPKPIILAPVDGLSIDGYYGRDSNGKYVVKSGNDYVAEGTNTITTAIDGIGCELDPILHEEILQRAVELAKIAWEGTPTSSVQAGQRSE